ncbi:SAF domain-containing protein [Alicyclobacillus macrosporangiidus]|uniref:SAF domain-containing protein n=1 Tax=Alicyclobacillus macrosporangiidus TaxID=392015 RepID=UPI001E37B3BC|nr:SAF domain-containing protein [Alicyclobacillus macrosporangiidus]
METVKRSTFLLMGVGLAVVAGGLFAFGYKMATDTVPVVTAKSFIPADTPVQAGDLTTAQVPKSFARQMGALTRAGDVTGHYLSVSVVPGEPIMKGMLATTDDLQALASQYATEHHTDGVLVDYPANSALASAAQPGQDVALVVTPQGQNAVPKLYPVHVLAVSAPQTQQSSPLSLNNNNSGKTLFLFVPSDEYAAIAPALTAGQAHVVFLSAGQTAATNPVATQTNPATGINSTVPQTNPAASK